MESKQLKDHHGRLVPTYSATDAKNSFGAVLEDAARYGAVGITKRDRPRFVVLSVEEYANLQPPTLPDLEAEFDRRVAAMQTPEAAAAYRRLFDASPEELAEIARVDPARKTTRSKKVRAKRVHKVHKRRA